MATKDETNTSQLPAFSTLKPYEQLAITLRSEGKTLREIVNTINTEYELAYKEISVREWFWAGGRLEQAYMEYNEALADQSVTEAKLKLKKITSKAADTLDELMGEEFAGAVRRNAAKDVLAKYVPDRQVIVDERSADEVPSAIADAGDAIVEGKEQGGPADKQEEQADGSKPVDDTPEGPSPDKPDGSGSG